MSQCYCASGKSFAECCEPNLNAGTANTAEALMRSRYSAYAVNNIDYIENTQIKMDNDDFSREDAEKWAKESKWLGLRVIKTRLGGEEDEQGVVEFQAAYEDAEGNQHVHHEISNFEKVDGKWMYKDGQIVGPGPITRNTPKIGRNDPCHCGSGKKYKKCHLPLEA